MRSQTAATAGYPAPGRRQSYGSVSAAEDIKAPSEARALREPQLVRLRDGSKATVRAARAGDEPAVLVLLGSLRPDELRMRFFTGAVNLDKAAHDESSVQDGRFGLVAHDSSGMLVAHAFYACLDDARAEVAVEVADHLHGRGLGTLLLEMLARVAEDEGIHTFHAEVLPDNHAMLNVFRKAFAAHVRFRAGVEHVEFATSAWRAARERLSA